MKHNREVMLAYLAGLVDGEGCIRIKKTKPYKHLTGRVNPGYSEAIQIRMVNPEGIEIMVEMFGGHYYREQPHSAQGRPLYCYQATDMKAVALCRELLPYLIIKREQAECVLALRKLKDEQPRSKRGKAFTIPHSKTGQPVLIEGRSFDADAIAAREELYLRCKMLKTV